MSTLDDPERLRALGATCLMDTPPEPDFDRITRLISRFLKVEVSLISLVDASRQFFKSSHGLEERVGECTGTPLTHSFCQHVVVSEKHLVVEDARTHDLVKENLAVRDLNVISYLGVPLHTPDGHVIGSLCAIGTAPRSWSAQDEATLADFACVVENAIALRMQSAKSDLLAEKNRLLANEFNHRAKNLLAVVKSLVNLSARESETLKDMVTTLSGRLDAYSLAHDAVSGVSGLFDLEALLRQLLTPYKATGSIIIKPGAPVRLMREQVTPVCLIVHELATNSAKYGAFKLLKQPIVSWATEPGRAVLIWEEPVPITDAPDEAAIGFGTKLLTTAARQLGGDITRKWEDGRLIVRFAVKIAPASPPAA